MCHQFYLLFELHMAHLINRRRVHFIGEKIILLFNFSFVEIISGKFWKYKTRVYFMFIFFIWKKWRESFELQRNTRQQPRIILYFFLDKLGNEGFVFCEEFFENKAIWTRILFFLFCTKYFVKTQASFCVEPFHITSLYFVRTWQYFHKDFPIKRFASTRQLAIF